jgi:hypothetical protein
MTTLHSLNKRVAKLEATTHPEPSVRLVLLFGPEGLTAEQRAQVDEAQRAGRAVAYIELVPAVGTGAVTVERQP